MTSGKGPNELAAEWKEACNSHDLDRILALYREDVIFKSPRVRTVSGEESGILRGKSAVRDYWRRILERRPDLHCAVGHVFAGVDSVALEYRFANGLHGIEFMTVDGTAAVISPIGKVCSTSGDFLISGGAAGPVAMGLRKKLVDIQYGRAADPHNWIRKVL
jgi:ketosteroid isomerase-like protein